MRRVRQGGARDDGHSEYLDDARRAASFLARTMEGGGATLLRPPPERQGEGASRRMPRTMPTDFGCRALQDDGDPAWLDWGTQRCNAASMNVRIRLKAAGQHAERTRRPAAAQESPDGQNGCPSVACSNC